MSSPQREREKRAARAAAYEEEQAALSARRHELDTMSTRGLLYEAYGHDDTDPKVVFFNRLLDHLSTLGINPDDL